MFMFMFQRYLMWCQFLNVADMQMKDLRVLPSQLYWPRHRGQGLLAHRQGVLGGGAWYDLLMRRP
jgi:hypothetical protein